MPIAQEIKEFLLADLAIPARVHWMHGVHGWEGAWDAWVHGVHGYMLDMQQGLLPVSYLWLHSNLHLDMFVRPNSYKQ